MTHSPLACENSRRMIRRRGKKCGVERSSACEACGRYVKVMMDYVLFGYLDPGTGSMLLQAIVGGSAGLLVFVRHMWRSFRASRPATASATPTAGN